MRTKIICTIGPASSSYEILKQLVMAGMKLARLNFSHGTHEEHSQVIKLIREISGELNVPIGIIQDLPGPRLRIGGLRDGAIRLADGAIFTLTIDDVEGDSTKVSVDYADLPREVKKGYEIFLADGTIKLIVIDTSEKDITCKVAAGGILHSGKGINIPGYETKMPAVTEKDLSHIDFGIKNQVDFIALSFVQSSDDITKARRIIKRKNGKAGIVAKIERAVAFNDINRIIRNSDGIMIARGDLGVELEIESIPILQKRIIRDCNMYGKPVITATQMLMSMVLNLRPTRAEVSDVANAIFDGTDAIMLSEETAVGKYPVEAVKVMARVADIAEKKLPYKEILAQRELSARHTTKDIISYTACQIANGIDAAAIVIPTRSGSTAHRISRYRPSKTILAFTVDPALQRKLLLPWGVKPYLTMEPLNIDIVLKDAEKILMIEENVKIPNHIVVVSGGPRSKVGTTNMIRIETIGKPNRSERV